MVQEEGKELMRIRYADDEDHKSRPLRRRRDSQGSLSIRSISRTREFDPSTALPIQYRTLSIEIDESKEVTRQTKPLKGQTPLFSGFEDIDWHTLSIEEITLRLSTSTTLGLSSEQATRKLKENGRNIPSPPPTHLVKDLLGYFFGGFGSILLVAGVLVFVAWKPLGNPPLLANLALAIVLITVFFIQAGFNAWQDWSTSRVMASITTVLPESCMVIRDGMPQDVFASEITPGDVVFVNAGNRLPADLRFIQCSTDAKFDRSVLTGESRPVHGSIVSTSHNYLETECIGMAGTHCITGTATGIVVATGDNTVFGRIAKLTSAPKTGLTPLQKEVLRFVILIVSTMVAMILIVIIVWASWLRHSHPEWISVPALIVDCVSVAVAFIPEGLPIALTVSLTIVANMMRKNKILCKSLKTVETLGSVTVICSDKTGTLTKNQMHVASVYIGKQSFTPEEARDQMTVDTRTASENEFFNSVCQLRSISGLCNAGQFDLTTLGLPLHERKITGDATDQAVLRLSESLGPVSDIRSCWHQRFDLAFDSKNKYMIRVFDQPTEAGLRYTVSKREANDFTEKRSLLTIKGAPDILLGKCSYFVANDGSVEPITDDRYENFRNVKDKWSAQGQRVIALARKTGPSFTDFPVGGRELEQAIKSYAQDDLILVGLVGIIDPPRDEIPSVVGTLRRAGIRVFMVTGDFKLTALAIAKECGIVSNEIAAVDTLATLKDGKVAATEDEEEDVNGLVIQKSKYSSIVLNGTELITLNERQWDALCKYDEIVFARTTPEQKLRIVKEFQARDETVGMTGDGVNDAPSLKAADIGIAVGSGSDIAIEAADMVLLDSFSAIVEAVKYGRVVFDNLKKTICYLLPAGSFSEFWPVITNVVLGLPQILSSFLMIIICCFTDCGAATAIAYEAPEADVLLRRPRNAKKDRLVDWKLVLHAYGFVGLYQTFLSFTMSYWYVQRRGVSFSSLWLGFGAPSNDLEPSYVTTVLNQASSIYFVNLVVMQWFNLMATRTRRRSIFQQPPLFNKETQNIWLFPAILFALLIVFFFLYIPKLQAVLETTDVPVEHFFLPMAFGLGGLLLDEGRKYCVRKWPKGFFAKIAW